ncbi:MAG TPA: class I SAM-dependent methyltransferase [Polyangiaceae bacterium]|nr:class I SAM-dependent methyltransferase [Polyangiaceae bacterium]
MRPTTSHEFDQAYERPFTVWGDFRVPTEIADLIRHGQPQRVFELGCGVGRFSRYVAKQGVRVTGVDFSSVAIGKARARVAADATPPEFLVGDVTKLVQVEGPYDCGFDVGCFHCLDEAGQRAYASEVARILKPSGTHLLWALDTTPTNEHLMPARIEQVFHSSFRLQEARTSRRRLARSHWYWLVRH